MEREPLRKLNSVLQNFRCVGFISAMLSNEPFKGASGLFRFNQNRIDTDGPLYLIYPPTPEH